MSDVCALMMRLDCQLLRHFCTTNAYVCLVRDVLVILGEMFLKKLLWYRTESEYRYLKQCLV